MLKTISSITNAIGALNFKGTWNASTNTPTIVSSVGTKGDYFVVGVAGSTTINGISNWGVGDWIAYNGSVWQRVEGGADLNGVNLSVSGISTLSGAVTVNASVTATLFKTDSGSVSAANTTATTIFTAPTLNNGTYIVSCNVVAGDPTNYSAVSLVTVDATVLRATALQTAALLSISVSGQTIRATQLSGSTANILYTVTRVS